VEANQPIHRHLPLALFTMEDSKDKNASSTQKREITTTHGETASKINWTGISM